MNNEEKISQCETERENKQSEIAEDLHEQAGLIDCGVDEWGNTEWLGEKKAWDKYEELTKNN